MTYARKNFYTIDKGNRGRTTMNIRVWYITITDEKGDRIEGKTLNDRDEVAALLHDMDMKGYFISSWTFNCDYGSSYLIRVELVVRFGNYCIENIAEHLGRILGEEK